MKDEVKDGVDTPSALMPSALSQMAPVQVPGREEGGRELNAPNPVSVWQLDGSLPTSQLGFSCNSGLMRPLLCLNV